MFRTPKYVGLVSVRQMLAALVLMFSSHAALAQLPFSENFQNFTGSGFSPTPAAGQLDSDIWSIAGFDTNVAFGGTETTTSTDPTRGSSTGGVSTGGVYAFNTGSSIALGVQPGGSDFTPGDFILRINNNTGSTVDSLDVSYKIWVRNDQARANSFNFSYSVNGGAFTNVSALNFTSAATADATPSWQSNDRSATLTSLGLASGHNIELKWTGNDASGSGSRDEFALDDVSVSVSSGSPTVTLSVSSNSGTEATPATDITVTATASSAVSGDQTVNLAVTGTDITAGDYSLTNTTITILSGQTTGSVTFTIADDTDVESAETATLTISTPSAGISLSSTTSQAIAITDNDAGGTLSYSPTSLSETRTLDGVIADKITITLSGDTFTGSDGDNFVTASKVAVSNVPAGLTATVTRTSATTAELSFSGTASSHANSNDVNTLTLVFANSAFTSGNAVLNSTKNDLNLDFGDAGAAGSTQTFTPNTGTTLDNSDASTALALDANWMVVADDEASVLRVYPRAGGAAVMEWSFATGLGTGTSEIDLEASTRIGNSLYFIGSHSNKKDGTAQSSREHLFEVTVTGTGANTQFTYVGKQTGLETALKTWDNGNTHGKGADYFGFTASAGAGVIPENVNGFSIEGMTATQDGTQLLLAFRAPMANTTVRDKAVIVPVSVTGLIGGSPTFGTPFELNLGGRGVRSIEKAVTGSDYLILAGPSVSATTEVTHDFRLYRWDGSSSTPTELDVDLDTLLVSTGGSFETLVDVLSTAQGTLIQLLQDNGDTIWSGQTQPSKNLAAAAQKFQGNWVSLDADVVTDTTPPTLVSSSPINSTTNATVNADMVLKFNKAVKAGTGNFVIKKASDNSTVETLALGSANVSIAYNTVTLNPTTNLDYNTAYYVEASNTVITDTANNEWGGLSGSTAYSFTTAIATSLPSVLITEVNSNATGGDFFELYNYGSTAIDLTGWKWNDDSADSSIATAFPATATTLAAGARLVIVASADTSAFLPAWNLPASAPIHANGGPGLGGGDAVVVFDSAGKVVAFFNYGTATLNATDSTVIAPATRSDATTSVGGHTGLAMGGGDAKASAIWDEQSTSTPKYTYAQAGQRGAFSQATAANGTGSPTVIPIHTIQGTGTTAALTGVQTISGIVTKKFSGLTGFFVQEENTDADNDPAASEGIFIYDNSNLFTGNVGDLVRITGTVAEYTSGSSSSTQLSSLTNVTVISTGNTLPTAATVQIPVTNVSDLERFEGMLVNVSSTNGNLVVTETYRLGQYGQATLADSRLQQFTHANLPSTSGYPTHLANIAKRIIYLDDGSSAQNPDPEIFARGGNPLSASNTLRSGDTVSSVTGILDHRYEGYRVQTTSGVNFTAANTRPASAPSVGAANVKVASFNLLNYFNTFDGLPNTVDNCNNGVGGTAADCRGADDATEFTRQKDKHKQVFVGLNADVIGLMELENDGYDSTSAQQDLLNLINGASLSGRNYKMVDADTLIGSTNALGTDAIKIGLIYDDNAVELVAGSVKTSNDAIFDRRPLAATFKHKTSNEKFTVVVNHLKSKGSAGSLAGDTDQNDGQGNSNATRVAQAQALVTFLATLTDDPDILVMGDMNAYAQENPITTIKNAGYTDLLGSSKYSYVFDGQIGYLDHALASSSLVPQVTGTDDWHINSDEPSVLDYNTNFKSTGQQTSFYNADPYRSSDHDPVLIGLKLSPFYNITLTAAGNGSGTISSNGTPAGVACGTNCLRYTSSTAVQLQASANAGSTFTGWSCSPAFTSGQTLNADTVCTATFIQNTPQTQYFDLTLQKTGTGQGTFTGTPAGSYPIGTWVNLTAVASTDSLFKNWNPSYCGSGFPLNTDTVCTAEFVQRETAPQPTPDPEEPITPPVVEPPVIVPVEPPVVPVDPQLPEKEKEPELPTTPTTPVTPQPPTPSPEEPTPSVPDVPHAGVQSTAVCVPHSVQRTVCNARWQDIQSELITETGVIADAVLSTTVENRGWLINAQLTETAVLIGGKLSGTIHNRGVIRDIEFVGKQIQGGYLGGIIKNNSSVSAVIMDIIFEPNSVLWGGYLTGIIQGDPVAPVVLRNVKVLPKTQLSHVIIGENVSLSPDVFMGIGVRFAHELSCHPHKPRGQSLFGVPNVDSCLEQTARRLRITTASEHRGKSADLIFAAADKSERAYTFDGENWQVIPVEISAIMSAQHLKQLPLTVELDLPATHYFNAVYFGYRLEDGEIIYWQLE
ncbi:ExeM/NucH family extracellular endonuclease [Thioflexithrix psekupsensis]|nr:ExeM/NucH family extracellular endonuclease [Thioflexithrix psekupsensis]